MNNYYWRIRDFYPNGNRRDELRRAVINNEVYCPSPNDFNDPFDVNPIIRFRHVSVEDQIDWVERQIARNSAPPDVAEAALRRACQGYMNSAEYHQECRNNFRAEIRGTSVLSLFHDVNNAAMWAYYGGSGSGYAIGFDFCEPLPDGEYPLPVTYSARRPHVDFNEDFAENGEGRREFLWQCFLTKATVWDKEEEYRLIFPDSEPGYRNFGSGKVAAVCLGFNPHPELIEEVETLCAEVDGTVSFYRISLCDSTYSLRVLPFSG